MKSLTEYTEQGITDLLNKYGGFFAFSDKQFNEGKKEGVEYISCGAGLICPKENAKLLVDGITQVGDNGVQQDLQENGKDKIIERELYNHEAFYTWDIEDTCDAVRQYGISESEVQAVFNRLSKTINA